MKLINEGHSYSCLMFNLEGEIANKIIEYNLEYIPEETLVLSEAENNIIEPHITIFYGIHSNNYKSIKKYLHLLNREIIVTLGKVDKFLSQDCDIIKINVIDSENILRNIWELIKKNVPNSNDFDSYSPHITLSYVQKDTCDNLIGDDYFDGMKIKLNLIKFSSHDNKTKFFRINK